MRRGRARASSPCLGSVARGREIRCGACFSELAPKGHRDADAGQYAEVDQSTRGNPERRNDSEQFVLPRLRKTALRAGGDPLSMIA